MRFACARVCAVFNESRAVSLSPLVLVRSSDDSYDVGKTSIGHFPLHRN